MHSLLLFLSCVVKALYDYTATIDEEYVALVDLDDVDG